MPVAWHSNPEIKSPSLFSLCLLKPYMCVYVLHKHLLSADKFLAFHSLTVLEGRCINLHIAQLTVCTRDRLALCQTRSMPCISPASHTYSFIQSNPMRRETYYPSSARNFRHGLSQPVPGYTAILTPGLRLQQAAEDPDSSFVPLNEQCNLEPCPARSFPAREMRALGKMVWTDCRNSDVQSFP